MDCTIEVYDPFFFCRMDDDMQVLSTKKDDTNTPNSSIVEVEVLFV